MKLIKEVVPKQKVGYPTLRRYLLLAEVSDEDAKILGLCNMERVEKLDKNGAEAWMVY